MDVDMIRTGRRSSMTAVAAPARSRVMPTAAGLEPGLHAWLEHAGMGAPP
jgi:hypothetical protein